jgi:hypothetical protein
MFVIYKCLKLPGGVFQNQGREFYLYLADTWAESSSELLWSPFVHRLSVYLWTY